MSPIPRQRGSRFANLAGVLDNIPPPLAPRVPRTPPDPAWEASRHAREVAYWAKNFDELEKRLGRMRRTRGDEMTKLLLRGVVAEIKAKHSEDESVFARERLQECWRRAGTRDERF